MEVRAITIEICVESVEGALAAARGGADRIELCSALSEGGLTPSHGLLAQVLHECRLPVMVMIRPRDGSFVYSDHEFSVMMTDIRRVRNLAAVGNVQGIVTGVLHPDGTVDVERNRQLTEAAYPLSCTFHRAIDVSINPLEALDSILDCGYDRVLTSGQAVGAAGGTAVIRQLVERSAGRIAVMAGAGVRPENVAELIRQTGVMEVHSSASVWVEDYRSTPARDALGRRETSIELVMGLRQTVTNSETSITT